MIHPSPRTLLLAVTSAFSSVPARIDPGSGTDAVPGAQAAAAESKPDRPLAAYQSELLELAFDAATAIPVKPHIKDRSRAQEAVVDACLELDQKQRALGWIERIDNWRRGTAYADAAFRFAQLGAVDEAQRCLDRAQQIADDVVGDDAQEWQRDRIRVKIGRAHVLLGHEELAAGFEAGVVAAESGKVDAERAKRIDAGAFDAQVKALDAILATRDFDRVRNALEVCAQLFSRFYGDEERRAQAESRIRSGWTNLPVPVRFELLLELAGFALDHGDRAKALELASEASQMLDGLAAAPEDRIPRVAAIGVLRHRAGAEAEARRDVDAALATYAQSRAKIVDIDRAGALRAIAEAYQAIGDTAAALAAYRTAVEEGAVNPNSRPRAQDLSATCSSMAVHGVEPDQPLRARMRQLFDALAQPW